MNNQQSYNSDWDLVIEPKKRLLSIIVFNRQERTFMDTI